MTGSIQSTILRYRWLLATGLLFLALGLSRVEVPGWTVGEPVALAVNAPQTQAALGDSAVQFIREQNTAAPAPAALAATGHHTADHPPAAPSTSGNGIMARLKRLLGATDAHDHDHGRQHHAHDDGHAHSGDRAATVVGEATSPIIDNPRPLGYAELAGGTYIIVGIEGTMTGHGEGGGIPSYGVVVLERSETSYRPVELIVAGDCTGRGVAFGTKVGSSSTGAVIVLGATQDSRVSLGSGFDLQAEDGRMQAWADPGFHDRDTEVFRLGGQVEAGVCR